MDSGHNNDAVPERDIVGFVRFCHERRRVGWPDLYDEMCAVASRRLYRGWGLAELADHGIGFSLFETPALAAAARAVVREDAERRPVLGRSRRSTDQLADRQPARSDDTADDSSVPTLSLAVAAPA